MRTDLERFPAAIRPLVGDVEGADGSDTSSRGGARERDEDIIRLLRQKLKDRAPAGQAPSPLAKPLLRKILPGEEDKYEPQRINRKICWQYDSSAKKVPLLRRHYI